VIRETEVLAAFRGAYVYILEVILLDAVGINFSRADKEKRSEKPANGHFRYRVHWKLAWLAQGNFGSGRNRF